MAPLAQPSGVVATRPVLLSGLVDLLSRRARLWRRVVVVVVVVPGGGSR
jgi:hypothetical protein